MDKILKPDKLSIDPNSSTASKQWRHWIRTFKSYISRFVDNGSEDSNGDKLAALISCATPDVFEYIDSCETYDEAEAVLQRLYVKQPNEIFYQLIWSFVIGWDVSGCLGHIIDRPEPFWGSGRT